MKVPDEMYQVLKKNAQTPYIWLDAYHWKGEKGVYNSKWRLILDPNENYRSLIDY
jgi:hypothetical protein